jgi:hypothetical protein
MFIKIIAVRPENHTKDEKKGELRIEGNLILKQAVCNIQGVS